jgi:hypothetical protein
MEGRFVRIEAPGGLSWPEARYLLSQIVAHVESKEFRPTVALPDAGLERLFQAVASP